VAWLLLCAAVSAGSTFESVSVSIRGGLRSVEGSVATVKVSADGTCLCRVPGRPALGEGRAWPPATLVHKLSPQRVQELEPLLDDTKWLTVPRAGGPARVDATQYAITALRFGREQTVTCGGSWPAPYLSLIGFFDAIMHQENLFYRVTLDGAVGTAHYVAEEMTDQSNEPNPLQGHTSREWPSPRCSN